MKYCANVCGAQAINSNPKLKPCLVWNTHPGSGLGLKTQLNQTKAGRVMCMIEKGTGLKTSRSKVRERSVLFYHLGDRCYRKEIVSYFSC